MTVADLALPPGRASFDEAAVDLCARPGDRATLHTTLDAIRAIVQFPETQALLFPTLKPAVETFPVGSHIDGTATVLGHVKVWTFADAAEVMETVFGEDAIRRAAHCVGHYRARPVDAEDQLFFFMVGLLLKAGWTKDDGFAWTFAVPELAHDAKALLSLASRWVGRWDLASFNAHVEAGFTAEQLEQKLTTAAE